MKKLLLFSLFPFLIFSQTQIGNDIDGKNAQECSGLSVSLSSDGATLAVGSCNRKKTSGDVAQVRVFKNLSGIWSQIGDDINGNIDKDELVNTVSLSSNGNILAI